MQEPLSDAAVEVVERCQRRLRLLEPGSETAEVVEHAMTLAMSSGRPSKAPDFLFGDALRDARRTIVRSRNRTLRVVRETGRLATQGVRTGATAGFIDSESPEQRVLARELVAILRQHAHDLGGPAPRVLDGLLTDEPELETAAAAGVSRSTVTRLRRAFRSCASLNGYAPPAAA
jgi:hypothetical protein